MFIEKTPSNNSEDLKKIREERGLSLEDLFKQTRVRVVYLQAIENKEFNLLPISVYSKNFIKIYAHALGIDSEPIINQYEDYLNSLKDHTIQQENVTGEKFSFAGIAGKKTYLVIAIILIVVIVAHWLISKQYESSSDIVNSSSINANALKGNKEQNSNTDISLNQKIESRSVAQKEDIKKMPVEQKTSESSVENKSMTNSGKILPQSVNIPNAPDKEAALLSVNAIEETWLRVKPDQNPSFQILLKAGEKFEYKAKSFDIDIGNAGGIKIKFKGRDIENLGKRGAVVHLRLP